MLKSLLAGFGGALIALVAVFGFNVWAGNIGYMNPGSLALPITGADFNSLINQINTNMIPGGPGGSSGASGTQSGAFSVNSSNALSAVASSTPAAFAAPVTVPPGIAPYGNVANGIQVTGGQTGVAPTITAIGSDANVNLALAAQGNGLVQFAEETSWVSFPSLTTCPGWTGRLAQTTPNDGQVLSPSPTVTGYLYVLDYLGKPHAIPTC